MSNFSYSYTLRNKWNEFWFGKPIFYRGSIVNQKDFDYTMVDVHINGREVEVYINGDLLIRNER